MAGNVLFVTGIEPANSRAKNLLASERRAHAARVSHQRRKATKTAASRKPHCVWSTNKSRTCQPDYHAGLAYQSAWLEADFPQSYGHSSNQYFPFAFEVDDEAVDSTQWTATGIGGRRNSRSPSRLAKHPPVFKQMQSEISVIFEHTYQKESFYAWTTVLSQRTAKLGFYCRDMFLRVIPQRAVGSQGLQDMVLAHALAHEHRRANPKDGPQLSMKALFHYTRGLQAMYRAQVQGLDFLAAICMAFLVEAGQNNHSGSMKHVKGYEEVILGYQGEHDSEYRTIKGCYYAMRVYGELMALGRLPRQTTEPYSIERSRRDVVQIISDMEDRVTLRNPLVSHRIKVSLGQWLNAERDQHRSYETSINREAILLLLHFAVTLMPQDDVGWLSGEADPEQVCHLICAAEGYIRQGRNMNVNDWTQLIVTLKTLAVCMVRYVPYKTKCHLKAQELLRDLESRGGKDKTEPKP